MLLSSTRAALSCRASAAGRRRFFVSSLPSSHRQRTQYAFTSVAASVALAALATVAAQQQHDVEEEVVETAQAWSSLVPSPVKTACFSLIPMPSGGLDASSNVGQKNKLRRHHTVELLESGAALEGVDSLYKVDWNKPLGLGTFGAVYKGIHRRTGKRVAVKKIPKHYTNFATFQREMDALFQISGAGGHPNINSILEHFVGENGDDSYYLVLDMIEGGEMFDQLCAKGAYSEADAAQLIRQVASALAFLHGMGLIHSDLK